MAQSNATTGMGSSESPGLLLARDIKIAHSIFAMPFAMLVAFLARDSADAWGAFAGQFVLIIACMVTARTAAMIANRLLDRRIDARNPRTSGRAIASGRVAARDALMFLIGCIVVFVAFCAAFGFLFDNWWPFLLSVPVLAWICAYPLLKRATWWCHAYLGSSLAISPIAAAIAIRPAALGEQPSLWLMSAMVLFWVAGFDVIYALQDIDVDRDQGLHSVPGRFGAHKVLWISRALHAISFVALVLMAMFDQRLRTAWFGSAVATVLILLIVEHIVMARFGTARIQLAFFTLNGVISCVIGAAGIVSVVLH